MKLAQRFAFYGVGFVIGLIILFFFLGGKKTSCDYGFDARTLKNIRSKKIQFSSEAEVALQNFNLDTAAINKILRLGDVDFSETNRSLDSCKIYLINGEIAEKSFNLKIENCNKTANVISIQKE